MTTYDTVHIILLITLIVAIFTSLCITIRDSKKKKVKDDYKEITLYNNDNFKTTIMVLNLVLDNYFNFFLKQKKTLLSSRTDSTANLNNKIELDKIYSKSVEDILEKYISKNLIIQLNYFFTSQSLAIYICSYFQKIFDEIGVINV